MSDIRMDNRVLLVAAVCVDKQGEAAQQARLDHMQGHLDYFESILDKVAVAGPIFGKDGEPPIGSILVYKTADKAEACALLEADPYYHADIWEKVDLHLFRGAGGDLVGGKAW